MTLMTPAMHEAAHQAARAHQQRAEDAIRALLGRWISELEPTVAWNQEYGVIGLSYGGAIVIACLDDGEAR